MSETETPALTGMAAVDALLQPFNRGDAPGLVIAISRDGQTLCRRGFGLASLEHSVANTPHTRMRIGSTSKQFCCLAVLLLAEQGLLSIDDPVHLHLPELPRLGTGPTLRQLMNHTSGWRCNISLSFIAHGHAIQPKGSALPLLARQSELSFEPGSQMMYSNGGYQLLSKVVERVSGQGYEPFLAERIFAPLGMTDTESLPSDFDIRQGMATLYATQPGGGWRRGMFPSEEMAGEGGMISTVDDMLRWTAHLRSADKQIGRPESWAQMLEPTLLSSGTVLGYGLGLMRHQYRGVEVIHHAGGVIGGTAQMITVPAHGLDIVLMSNGAPLSPAALAFKIIDALLADVLTGPVEERALASAYPALLGARYHDAATGLLVGFAEVAGKLGLSLLGMPAIPLRGSPQRLWLECHDIALSPIAIDTTGWAADAAPAAITLAEGGQLRHMVRLPEEAPSAVAIAEIAEQCCGDYRAPDIEARARMTLEDGRLMLRIQGLRGSEELEVQPLSSELLGCLSTDALIKASGAGGALNLERCAGRVTGFRMDVFRIRHLHFVRDEISA
nr:serine hydrolase domain-containing protein [uncultured Roseateles sp.]